MDEEQISELLKSHSIRPSFQRMKIYQYLIDKKNHPSVEMIYHELVQQIPTLSKTTVYNTLRLFIEKKLSSVITIDETETRFDADTSLHGHFMCIKCGTIYDISIGKSLLKHEIFKKTRIEEHHIYFKGVCSEYCSGYYNINLKN